MCILLINYIVRKWKRKSCPEASSQGTLSQDSSGETQPAKLLPQPLRKKQHFLLKIAEKISVDRRHLMKSVYQQHSAIQKNTFDDLLSRQSSFQESLYEGFLQKNSEHNERLEDIQETLEALKGDFLTLRNQLKHTTPSLTKPSRRKGKKLSSLNAATVPTQTEGEAEEEQSEDILNTELMNSIVVATKDSFEELTAEVKKEGKEIIRNISRFLEQSHKEIQKEMKMFSSVANESNKDERDENSFSLIDEIQKVEKKLLDTFIFFNKHRFEMENLQKMVKYFNKRFVYASAKFNTCWQKSMATYSGASQRLEESEGLCNCTAKKFEKSSRCLIQQSKTLRSVISDMQNILNCENNCVCLSLSLDNLDESTGEQTEKPWAERFEDFNQKFQDLLSATDSTKGKLLSLAQSTTKLESLYDLIKSISNGYNSVINFLLSPYKKSDIVSAVSCQESSKGKEEPNNLIEMGKDNRSKVMTMMDNCTDHESIVTDENSTQNAKNDICNAKIACLWNEAYREVNNDPQDIDVNKITVIMKDIVRTTWELVDNDCSVPEDGSIKHYSTQMSDQLQFDEVEEECQESEIFLTDITSDCLIESLDDSDE